MFCSDRREDTMHNTRKTSSYLKGLCIVNGRASAQACHAKDGHGKGNDKGSKFLFHDEISLLEALRFEWDRSNDRAC